VSSAFAVFRTRAKRGRKLLYNSVTVICHKWKKPNADRRVEKVAEQTERGREGERGKDGELACVRAKKYQYSLRWWKQSCWLGLPPCLLSLVYLVLI